MKKSSDLCVQLPVMVICDDHLDNCSIFFHGIFKGLSNLKNSSTARLNSLILMFFLNSEQFVESST